jgi:glycosyltransferase involved in cell wall biosynthesis
MNILFYTPMNTRCRDIESQAIEFRKAGHHIFLLTQSAFGSLHESFAAYGYTVSSTEFFFNLSPANLLLRVFKLMWYCWSRKIDLVYAHLEPSNFIAVVAQYFIKSRVVICRHHLDYARLSGMDQYLSYKLTYKLAKDIIVVSPQTKRYMIKEEGVSESKIHAINLSYNFDLYEPPNPVKVIEIKSFYPSDILLLTVGRLSDLKRPQLSIQLLYELRKTNLNAKLLILGEGELMDDLKKDVNDLNLSAQVFFPGYVNNVLEYMSASDFLIHPSISESSCISLKEAGLVALPAIVCKGIGDFDEVLEDQRNGFLVDKDHFIDASFAIVQRHFQNKAELERIGEALRRDVRNKFDIRNVAGYYETTFHNTVS